MRRLLIQGGKSLELLARTEEHRQQGELEFDELYGMVDDPSAGLIGAFSLNREIVKEIDVYKRERLVGLNLFPHVFAIRWRKHHQPPRHGI